MSDEAKKIVRQYFAQINTHARRLSRILLVSIRSVSDIEAPTAEALIQLHNVLTHYRSGLEQQAKKGSYIN